MAEGERASTVERRRGRDEAATAFRREAVAAMSHMPVTRHIYQKNNAFQHKAAAMF